MAGQVRIGCSGWSYPHWRGRFYPETMPAREHFNVYAQHFDTVELNNSFYRQPPRERFVAWAQQAPPGFLFAVKGSRYVSHIKRMAVERKSIDMVVEPAEGLGSKLGPILFQFQGNFQLDLARLEAFLQMLPATHRVTLEFRHQSWHIEPVFDRLRACRIALCIPDHPTMPQSLQITSDFTYVRFHLPAHGLGYGKAALQPWADRIQNWRGDGFDVFVYFNNDMEGEAIKDGQTLKTLLGEQREGRDSNPGSGNTRSSA